MGSFETSDSHGNASLKPVRIPSRKEEIYRQALEMVESLENWQVVSKDDDACTIVCKRPGGLLAGTATITVTVDGPEGIPSSTVSVLEFTRPFTRRVC
jgi:hypothetical protein